MAESSPGNAEPQLGKNHTIPRPTGAHLPDNIA